MKSVLLRPLHDTRLLLWHLLWRTLLRGGLFRFLPEACQRFGGGKAEACSEYGVHVCCGFGEALPRGFGQVGVCGQLFADALMNLLVRCGGGAFVVGVVDDLRGLFGDL